MCERKKRIQNNPKTFGLNHRKDEVEMRKAVGWNRFVGKIKSTVWDMLSLRCYKMSK